MGSYKSLLVFRCGSKKKSLERQKGNFAGVFADLIVFLDAKSWLGRGELWCVDGDFSDSNDMPLFRSFTF
jgi:hypothetical protein